jgi:transcriptional regulator with XRE-family HTH domain
MTMDKVLFGERLRNAREASGMSQKLMASRLGVKSSTIGKWESGKEDPRANRLQMIASLLNVPLLWLLAGSQQVPDSVGGQDSEQLMKQKLAEVNARMRDLQNSLDDLELLIRGDA